MPLHTTHSAAEPRLQQTANLRALLLLLGAEVFTAAANEQSLYVLPGRQRNAVPFIRPGLRIARPGILLPASSSLQQAAAAKAERAQDSSCCRG